MWVPFNVEGLDPDPDHHWDGEERKERQREEQKCKRENVGQGGQTLHSQDYQVPTMVDLCCMKYAIPTLDEAEFFRS